ncbi:MAG: NfeD family protein [Dehalococcoidales bacterium]|nr:NfeD family protein [Dehalococcoidales bacterium]
MTGRLIFSIISTILEETAIVIIVRWGLPQAGIQIPLWGLVIIMAAWAGYSVFTHRLGTRALLRKQVVGLPHMIGTSGVVASPLTPEGLVRIKGELWVAKSASGEMKRGKKVIVVGQERLKLMVCQSSSTDSSEDNG